MADAKLPTRTRKFKNDLTAEQVRALLDYNPLTGEFRFRHRPDARKQWNTRYAGKVAGRIVQGYRRIVLLKSEYAAHRLAWLHTYGCWPDADIDHRNRDRSDNRIRNLRPATRSQNLCNAPISARNTSGYKGVSWNKLQGKWVAYLHKDLRMVHLGAFSSLEEAIAARYVAASDAHGQFYAER